MPLIKWKPEYTVHETELDSQHIRLFEILNTAYENVINSSEADCIKAVVSDLSEYLKYHFAAEEQLMEGNGYQEIDAHIAEHRVFAHTIEALQTNHHDNNLEVTKELIIVLGNWVLHHILIEDRKYSDSNSLGGFNAGVCP